MNEKVLLSVILFFLYFNNLSSEIIFRKANSVFVKVCYGGSAGSSFFNLDENLITKLSDDSSKYSEKDYTMELSKKTIGLFCEYSLFENLILFANIPMSFNNLEERYIADSNGVRYDKANYSLTHLDYLGIGVKYELYNRKSYSVLIFEARIPPGFKRGLIDTSKSSFLGDGAFELLTGMAFGVKTDKYLLESLFLYNFRDEEHADQFIIRTEAGICTVPNSKLSVTGDFVLSLKSFKEAIPLKTNQIVTQEDYFAIGFEFSMFFSESIYGEFNYNIKLLGKNSWNLGTYRVGLGVLF